MNTSKSAFSQLDPAISSQAIEQSLPSFDANRATGYAELGTLRSAKSASLAREQKLLVTKHGAAAPARVRLAAQMLSHNENLRRELASTREIVETPVPDVDANSFVVHGFVRRANHAGIPGLTLALTDEPGNWLRQYGYACTDKRGYFQLRIAAQSSGGPGKETPATKTEEELKKEAELKAKQEREAAAAAAAGQTPGTAAASSGTRININTNQPAAAAATPIPRSGQLRVFNRDGRVLHTEERPVVLTPDTTDYRLIILGDDDCGCTPPPEKSDGSTKPTTPRPPAAPPAAPAQPAASAPVARVAELKSYQNPPAPTTSSGQPLEAIRGIGPKTATKLRAAGIADVPEFEKTPGSALVKVAGFDKVPPKPTAAKPAAPAGKASTPTVKPGRSASKPVEKKPVKKSPAAKTKRPKKES